ncbi:MAG: phosphatase [Tyzzerella sp.]|nr:phosphatase [Tyzzerella sp.]
MKYLLDSHTHTIMSGHAYNTMQEMALAAKSLGLQAIAITDHAPTVPGICTMGYFTNFNVVDRFMYGIELLLGVELNIVDYEGKVDLPSSKLKKIDVGIASIHPNVGNGEKYPAYRPGDIKENTRAYLGAMENPDVDIIGHPDDSKVPVDYEALVKGARDNHVLLELNASSLDPFNVRGKGGAADNMKKMLRLCERYGTHVIVNSDAHCACAIAKFDKINEILQEVHFPEELVVNRDLNLYKSFLHRFN